MSGLLGKVSKLFYAENSTVERKLEEDAANEITKPSDVVLTSTEESDGEERHSGHVLWFNQKGFGKIRPSVLNNTRTTFDIDRVDELFVHISKIKDHNKNLIENEEVLFDIKKNDKGYEAINVERSSPLTRGEIKKWLKDEGYGFISCGDISEDVFVHKSDVVEKGVPRFDEGEIVDFIVVEDQQKEGKPQAKKLRRVYSRYAIERFANVGGLSSSDDDNLLKHLAENLAQVEMWDYKKTKSSRRYPILWSYIYYTFEQIEKEGKIAFSEDRGKKICCFNTGLVTDKQEEIFAYFIENKRRNPDDPIWKLSHFLKESDKRLTHFKQRPDIAHYFKDASELLCDPQKLADLVINYDHIIDDNIDRFPEQLRDNKFSLSAALQGTIEKAKKRVRRNFKTGIPQFYDGSIQILLPLCLTHPTHAELALVVSRENEVYRASTVLTLDMAYNNARLIAKPDLEWLEP